MKRNEHNCCVPTCENICPRAYPFCATCWRQVPKDLRADVLREIGKRATPDLDRSALFYAVSVASASVEEKTSNDDSWERVWAAAGSPELI